MKIVQDQSLDGTVQLLLILSPHIHIQFVKKFLMTGYWLGMKIAMTEFKDRVMHAKKTALGFILDGTAHIILRKCLHQNVILTAEIVFLSMDRKHVTMVTTQMVKDVIQLVQVLFLVGTALNSFQT